MQQLRMLWHFHLIAESHVQHMDPLGPHFSQIETTDAPLGMYPRISLLLMCTFCDAYHYCTLSVRLGPTHFCRIRHVQAMIDMCFFCGKDFCAPRGLGSCKVPLTTISIRNIGLGGSTIFSVRGPLQFFTHPFDRPSTCTSFAILPRIRDLNVRHGCFRHSKGCFREWHVHAFIVDVRWSLLFRVSEMKRQECRKQGRNVRRDHSWGLGGKRTKPKNKAFRHRRTKPHHDTHVVENRSNETRRTSIHLRNTLHQT